MNNIFSQVLNSEELFNEKKQYLSDLRKKIKNFSDESERLNQKLQSLNMDIEMKKLQVIQKNADFKWKAEREVVYKKNVAELKDTLLDKKLKLENTTAQVKQQRERFLEQASEFTKCQLAILNTGAGDSQSQAEQLAIEKKLLEDELASLKILNDKIQALKEKETEVDLRMKALSGEIEEYSQEYEEENEVLKQMERQKILLESELENDLEFRRLKDEFDRRRNESLIAELNLVNDELRKSQEELWKKYFYHH